MKKNSTLRSVLCVIISVLLISSVLAGCGGSSSAADNKSESYAAPAEPMVEMAEMDSYSRYDSASGLSGEFEDQTLGFVSSALPENVKLIYTADISLESTEFDKAVADLTELVLSSKGYYESSDVNNYGSYRRASYTIRVPASSFDSFCTAIGDVCQVKNISRSARDVSEAYYDTESRLLTQQTKLERLQELLAKAENMEDIITLESAISETELEIENLTGTLRKYDSLVGYSTIYISLSEVYKLTETEEPAIGFGAKLTSAFKSGTSGFIDDLQRSAINFARNWTGWLIFFVIAAIVILIIRASVRRRRRRKADGTIEKKEPRRVKKVKAEKVSGTDSETENK